MADIGETLREARMRSRIDITEVERRTKIRAKYLRAIENEEWDLLPGPIYAKSFLRTYGDFLGLDSRLLVDEYRRRYERPSDHDARPLSPVAGDRERRARRAGPPGWSILAAVLVAVLALLYLLGSGSTDRTTPPRAAVPVTTPSRAPARARRAARPTSRPRSGPVTLRLAPTGQVYVCLVDGGGQRLIDQRIFNAGDRVPPVRGARLLLTLGNASASLSLNGRPVAVAPSAQPIRLLITAAGARPIPLAARPTCP